MTSKIVSAAEVRLQFIDFFKSRGHLFIPSSSVLCGTGHGTYFTNAGMNQFRCVFEADNLSENHPLANVRKAVNSQRCIRMNDLTDVGRDGYHHTTFEMLGTWSFRLEDKIGSAVDRFAGKKEAINSAWELLTNVYGLEKSRLTATYFGGDATMGLKPDLETREVWLQLGIPAARVTLASAESNFWTMGEMGGPCGPCTELHYLTGAADGGPWPSLLELWNIVFISYSRDGSGSSHLLPRSHIDTGLGLERLVAVLNGKHSNYATDIFSPLFKELQSLYNLPPYRDVYDFEGDVNFIYRVIADHARMATIAIADGVLPSNRDLGHKVRSVLTRAYAQLVSIRGDSLHNLDKTFSKLARVVLEDSPLASAFPELACRLPAVTSALENEAQRFVNAWTAGKRAMNSLKSHSDFEIAGRKLNPEMACRLLDGSVPSMSFDLVLALAKSFGLTVDVAAVKNMLAAQQSKASSTASHSHIGSAGDIGKTIPGNILQQLRSKKIPTTCDLPQYEYTRVNPLYTTALYKFPPCEATILSVIPAIGEDTANCCWVVLDRSNLHPSNLGGQASDYGHLQIAGKTFRYPITMVQQIGSQNEAYILHRVEANPHDLPCGSLVKLFVDEDRRLAVMRAHTACHLTMAAVRALAKDVDASASFVSGTMQAGSSVEADRFTIDIQTPLQLTEAELLLEAQANLDKWINGEDGHSVVTNVVPVEETTKNPQIIRLPNEEYPAVVRVVKVGDDVSQELCCGTHVVRTNDIGAAVILNATGGRQGVKRFAVVTGPAAFAALEEGKRAEKLLNEMKATLAHAELSVELLNDVLRKLATARRLMDLPSLPRVVRLKIAADLEGITRQAVGRTSSLIGNVFGTTRNSTITVVPLAWRSLRTETTRSLIRSVTKQMQKGNMTKCPVIFIDIPIETITDRPCWVICALPHSPPNKTTWDHVIKQFNLRTDTKKDAHWLLVDGALPHKSLKNLQSSLENLVILLNPNEVVC